MNPNSTTAINAKDGEAVIDPPHQHEWQPNGTVEVQNMQRSPCSALDDMFWTEVLSLTVCACGKTRRTRVGIKNRYRRGDRRR